MGEKTKRMTAEEIRQAKYFSVIVDSTPDLAHVDQLTFFFSISILQNSLKKFWGYSVNNGNAIEIVAE